MALPYPASSLTLDAALFDLDGTLVRTFIDFPALREAMHTLARQSGEGAATDGLDDILEIVRVMVECKGGSGTKEGAKLRARAYDILAEMEQAGCAHPEPVDGAADLLETLRARSVKVGIITRNCRAVSEDLLHRMKLRFDTLIAREDTDEFKPDPTPILLACARLKISPTHASMTGDLWADIAAGHAADVALTIGIQWAHDPPDRFACAAPTIEVTSLAEAARYLL